MRMEKKRSDEDREQLKREQLGDRFVFNGCEWIELITEEDKRALEEGYKALIETE